MREYCQARRAVNAPQRHIEEFTKGSAANGFGMKQTAGPHLVLAIAPEESRRRKPGTGLHGALEEPGSVEPAFAGWSFCRDTGGIM
jgi:hypothetical protein